MADTKLSALVELAATPAVDDEVYIRDISEAAADESKRITIANLVAAADVGEGHITILPFNYDSIGQGTWLIGINTAQFSNSYFGNPDTAANGDNYSCKVFLQAGTYTMRTIAHGNTLHGIIDIDIDASEVMTFDTYRAAATYNIVSSQTAIAVAASGLKTLRVRLDGKHASAGAYRGMLSAITLWRTA